MKPTGKKGSFVTRYWLAIAIFLTVTLAWLFPGPALELPKWHVLDVGVIIIMFLGSLKLSPGKFKGAAKKPVYVILSVGSVFAMAPLLSLYMGYLFGFESSKDQVAVLISSAQASTLATGIVLTEVAGGDVALAMVMTVVNNFATVFLTPLIFKVASGTDIEVDHTAMGMEIALKIVLPVIVAQFVRIPIKDLVKRHGKKMSITTQLIILIYIYAGVAAGMERLPGFHTALAKVALFAVALHFTMLVINAAIARLVMKSSKDRTAFVLCSSQKTLPAAMLIWKSYFPAVPLGPMVAVVYHLVQLVADSVMAPGFRKMPLINDRGLPDREADQ